MLCQRKCNLLARDLLFTTTNERMEASVKKSKSNLAIIKDSSKMSAVSSSMEKSEHTHSSETAQGTSLKQTYPNVPPSTALRNLDRLLQKKPEPKCSENQSPFLSSTPHRRSAFRMHQSREDKENESRKLSQEKRVRRDSTEGLENDLSRSIDMSGQTRVGRLKRVDFDVKQLGTIKEEVVRTPLANSTNHHQEAK